MAPSGVCEIDQLHAVLGGILVAANTSMLRGRWVALLVLLAAASVARADPEQPLPGSAGRLQAPPQTTPIPMDRAQDPADHRALGVGLVGASFLTAGMLEYHLRFGTEPMPAGFTTGGDGYFEIDTTAGGADKLSHAWIAMVLTRTSSLTLRAFGWRPLPASLIGAGLTSGLLLAHEIEDGFASTFSPGDLLGTAGGALFAVATEVSPRFDDLFDYRIEYWPSQDYLGRLYEDDPSSMRSMSPLDDFSGQNYVLALHLGALPGAESPWLSWLRYFDATVGYHAEGYQTESFDDDDVVRQTFSAGISLNYLTILDRLLMGQRRVKTIRSARPAWRGLLEVLGLRGVGVHTELVERTAPRSSIESP